MYFRKVRQHQNHNGAFCAQKKNWREDKGKKAGRARGENESGNQNACLVAR